MRVLVVEDARTLAEVVAEGLRDQGMAVDIAYEADGRREVETGLQPQPYESD